MKLIFKLVIGIIVGILAGLIMPLPVMRILLTIRDIFGTFIGFMVPFLIIFFIASGVSGLGQRSGKAVGATLGLAYFSTVLAGTFAYFMISTMIPIASGPSSEITINTTILPIITLQVEPLMSVMAALLTAFVFGFGVAKTEAGQLKSIIEEGRGIVEWVIVKLIIPFLPIYIGCIFAVLTAEGIVLTILKAFGAVLLIVLLAHWCWLILQYFVAGFIRKENPFSLLRNMLPAYFAALGTMSSAATIPITLEAVRNNGVSRDVADFTVPLCATIHLSGSTITIVSCAFAVMILSPDLSPPTFGLMFPMIAMLALVMVAAPGVPGGGVMAALGILQSMLGFNETALGLMIALYMAQDSFGTATNVTGDGAISSIVDKWLSSESDKN